MLSFPPGFHCRPKLAWGLGRTQETYIVTCKLPQFIYPCVFCLPQIYLFAEPVQTLVDLICHPGQLSNVLQLDKDSVVTLNDISEQLCGTDLGNQTSLRSKRSTDLSQVTATMELLKTVAKSVSDVTAVSKFTNWWPCVRSDTQRLSFYSHF